MKCQRDQIMPQMSPHYIILHLQILRLFRWTNLKCMAPWLYSFFFLLPYILILHPDEWCIVISTPQCSSASMFLSLGQCLTFNIFETQEGMRGQTLLPGVAKVIQVVQKPMRKLFCLYSSFLMYLCPQLLVSSIWPTNLSVTCGNHRSWGKTVFSWLVGERLLSNAKAPFVQG